MKSYTHNQLTPSTDWVVNHNLDSYPVSDVIIDDGGERLKTLPLSLEYINSNTVLVRFSNPITGTVRLVGAYKFDLTPVVPELPVIVGNLVTAGNPLFGLGQPVFSRPNLGQFGMVYMEPNGGFTVSKSPNIRPQRIDIVFTSPTVYTVTGSLDGSFGTETLGNTFDSDILTFTLHNNANPGAPAFETGDTVYFDIASYADALAVGGYIAGIVANAGAQPNTPQATERWTVTYVSPTTFSVVGSVSGPQASAAVGVPYTNSYISFVIDNDTPVGPGSYFEIQFKNVIAAIHQEPPVTNNILFRDTFGGAAGSSLASRTPDVGPAWGTFTEIPSPVRFIYEPGAANLDRFKMNGAGGMWYGTSADQRYDLAVPMAVPGNGYFEMKFTLTDPGPGGTFTLYFGGALDVPIINGVPDENNWGMNTPDIALRFSKAAGFLHTYSGSSTSPSNGNDAPVAVPVSYGTEYTWRWEITAANGFVVTLSDGTTTATIVQDAGYTSLPHWPNVKYALGNFGPGFYFDSFKDAGDGTALSYTGISNAPALITSLEIGLL